MFDDSGSPSIVDPPDPPDPPDSAPTDPAVTRFLSCRWHDKKDGAEYCSHGEVLPYAGRNGFSPESWCLECGFYKLRRTVKKRDPDLAY